MSIDEMPILCVGKQLRKQDIDDFRQDMYMTYVELNNLLKEHNCVDMSAVRFDGYKYRLDPKDMYQNMYRIRNYVTKQR